MTKPKHRAANTKRRKKSEPQPYSQRWGAKEARYRTRLLHQLQRLRLEKPIFWWQERKIWQKIILILTATLIFIVGSMYGIAQWYIWSNRNQPTKLGATFVPYYAEYYGLDPQETFRAMVYDLGIRNFRLVSYWDKIESTEGTYDFSDLDWQFKMAEDTGSKISLAIGLRQPRWPECHMPQWAAKLPKEQWSIHLKTFMAKVIDRYKSSPVLESYQLENEYFLAVFGECPDFDRNRLIDEFNFVKQQDPGHPVIISRSNNAVGLPVGQPRPDKFGISVYKRVWDKTITKRYFEYPFPAWFYGFLAGAGKIVTGKDMIIHELQTEPWLPNDRGFHMNDVKDVKEQDKSLDANRLHHRIQYGKASGMKTIDLWGAEWWYWRKTKANDPSLWNTVKTEVQAVQRTDAYK